MKQAHRDGELGSNHTACLESETKVLEETMMPTDQKTDATHQRVAPINVTNDRGPVGAVGSQALRYATIHSQVMLNSSIAPREIERVQMIRRAARITAQPIKHSAVCTWWKRSGHGGDVANVRVGSMV